MKNYHIRPSQHRATEISQNAFTLVELLVVISIIALLIAILIPSLKKARAQAKNVVCMSNLHAIGVGSSTYAADAPNNVYPDGETLGWASFRVMAGRTFAFGEKEDLGLPAVFDRNGIIPRDSDVWLCPSNMTQLNKAEVVIGQNQYQLERDYGMTYRVTTRNQYTQNPMFHTPGGIRQELVEQDLASSTAPRRFFIYWVTDNWNLRPYKSNVPNNAIMGINDTRTASGNNTAQFRDTRYWHKGTTQGFNIEDENNEGGVIANGWGINALMLDLSAAFQAQSKFQHGDP